MKYHRLIFVATFFTDNKRLLRGIAETGGRNLRALLEVPQYLPERESSVEEWKGKCLRTDALLSAHYALAKGTNRQGQCEGESAKLSSKEISKIELGKSSSLIGGISYIKELIALRRKY